MDEKIGDAYIQVAKRARWMDLIGDYAGDELFIVDGESLIQLVLDDPLLDIGKSTGCGFQSTHAIFLLEAFLERLKSRNANFEIVFFKVTESATIRSATDTFRYASRKLARQILINHLGKLSICVLHVDDLDDDLWKEHETECKPMFVLISDTFPSLPAESVLKFQSRQRAFILHLLRHGMSAALMNGLELRDSKILTFVLEHLVVDRATASVTTKSMPSSQLYTDMAVSRPFMTREDVLVNVYKHILPESSRSPSRDSLLFTFLVHLYVLDVVPLCERTQNAYDIREDTVLRDEIFPSLFQAAARALHHTSVVLEIDTTIFVALHNFLCEGSSVQELLPPESASAITDIWRLAGGGNIPVLDGRLAVVRSGTTNLSHTDEVSLLSFTHPVFDDALSDIQVRSQQEIREPVQPFFDLSKVFSENRHWHNQRRIDESAPRKMTPWQLKGHQRYMMSLQRQAETLTGALGRGLKQISITMSHPPVAERKKINHSSAARKGKPNALSKKELLKKTLLCEKAAEKDHSSRLWFEKHLKDHDRDSVAQKQASLELLSRNVRFTEPWLSVEGSMYRLHLLIMSWIEHADCESSAVCDSFTVPIMRVIQELAVKPLLSSDVISTASKVLKALGFEAYIPHIFSADQDPVAHTLSFKFVKLFRSSGRALYPWMAITEHPVRWQLRLFGEYMDRSMDGAADTRVDFQPDGWQREALDCIDDANHSILVVAPTSAGKTFISFYAMEKVLRESNDGVLVYVAPTKALVNQITAEVYARFSKKLDQGTLWAIHTRDYRVNNPQNCQILVTVPEVLAIMLLSPPLAAKWTPRIKRIILDEIHTIGQQEGGAIWEQILLLSPCPFIGLSATVGSPDRFNEWLASIAKSRGWNHSFIQHKHRYSHLRKWYYQLDISGRVPFAGLKAYIPTTYLRFLHPISMLSFAHKSLPDDLALEARDTLSLVDTWKSCADTSTADNVQRLEPASFFEPIGPKLLTQKDILQYEAALKEELSRDAGVTEKVVRSLQDPVIPTGEPDKPSITAGLLPFVADLHSKQLLPALLFNFDRKDCEVLARDLLDKLVEAENRWKKSSPEWERKLGLWEKWKSGEKSRKRMEERVDKKVKNKEGMERDNAPERWQSWEASFHPDDPLPDFSFAGAFSTQELEEDLKMVWNLEGWLKDALYRGIAVHHSGMNKKYRSLVENLFRRGILRAIICTGTLALGINAPTRTSVFCGDSPFLTALMYRQCAGRAGRRGYDLLGNVVFYGLSIDRVRRLVLSRLPSLGGTFPLTPTLTLRLLSLLHGSGNAPVAVKAIKSLMELPQISFGSSTGRKQLLHHMRFNIEYLRRARLIDSEGIPVNLSAISCHLYYTEPSNFALIILLHRGILHRISAKPDSEREFISLMSHLFGRRYLPSALNGSAELSRLQSKYPSMIELPPIREDARDLLEKHDEQVRGIFVGYARAYAEQYTDDLGPDDTLPLSGIRYSGIPNIDSAFRRRLREGAQQPVIRSPFVALSGHTDSFTSIEELARTTRAGVHLNEYAIPNMRPYIVRDTGEHKLNAYLLDFFIHGQVAALNKANGIRPGDIWYCLQDFMLTLLTVKASLQQYMNQVSQSMDGDDEDETLVGTGLGDLDDEGREDEEDYKRPSNISNGDWAVYAMVRDATAKFDAKYKNMWA